MTRLDENRAKSQLARKAGVDVTAVTNVAIWGNHSATQYPDFYNAKINGQPADAGHQGRSVAEGRVHQPPCSSAARPSSRRRGSSSAASAANAVVDTVRSIVEPTPAGDWHSVCLCSDGSYGVEGGLDQLLPDPQRRQEAGDRSGRAGQRIQPRRRSTRRSTN